MNTFGRLYRITSFGESHGAGIGVVIDGCPAGLPLDLAAIQHQLDRRKPGQSRITTQRKEADQFEVLSGLVGNTTSGAPLAFFVRNEDQRSTDYGHIEQQFRPSHADYTYHTKYGIRDHRGGGRSSARETIARVIGGAVAQQLLARVAGVRVEAWVSAVGTLTYADMPATIDFHDENMEMVRCPDSAMAAQMVAAIDHARKSGDSLGGVISCRATGVPAGWGEPIYAKLHAELGAAMLSINAVKGFEIGSGFAGTQMPGSAHNDAFYTDDQGHTRTRSNHSGGIQGGISNGEDIFFRVAFKPTSTIMRDQESIDADGNPVVLQGKGRHDPCVVPRAIPIVEGMAAIVLADAWRIGLGSQLP
jgi:chorismate synthase